MKYFKCIYLTIYLLSHFVVNAQKLSVVYHFYPNENKNAISDKIPDSFNSKKQLKEYLQSLQKQLINEGYLAAGLDSIHLDSTQTKVYFYIGNKYTLAKLNKGNVPESILSEIGFRERFYYNKPFSPNQINKLFEKSF